MASSTVRPTWGWCSFGIKTEQTKPAKGGSRDSKKSSCKASASLPLLFSTAETLRSPEYELSSYLTGNLPRTKLTEFLCLRFLLLNYMRSTVRKYSTVDALLFHLATARRDLAHFTSFTFSDTKPLLITFFHLRRGLGRLFSCGKNERDKSRSDGLDRVGPSFSSQ